MATERATFAAGCFWGVETEFRRLEGVTNATVGYTGGTTADPTYEQVCTGLTGHAEAVQVEFDPQRVSYEELLDLFWEIHDPTTPDRQGPDVGTQYRSAIFAHDAEQEQAARASMQRLQADDRLRGRRIVTQIVPAAAFHPAEEYHQRYLEKRGQASCRIR